MKEIMLIRKLWKKVCWMIALTMVLLHLPVIVMAAHGDENETTSPDIGLIFNLSGCNTIQPPPIIQNDEGVDHDHDHVGGAVE